VTVTLNLSERLAAMDIDAVTRADLRELLPLITETIDAAVEAAYAQILQFPPVQQVFRGVSMDEAKRSQREHWLSDIFSANFTEAELANSVAMVERRQRAGLSVRWYFAFWTVIFIHLLRAVAAAYRRHPSKQERMLIAVCKAVMFDIEIFNAVYTHAAEGMAAMQLNQHADSFEREVAELVKSVVASTAKLQETAGTMSAAAGQTAEQAHAALAAGEQTAGNAAAVATNTQQLAESILDVGHRVAESTSIAATAVEQARRTDGLVRGLVEAGSRIGDVVKLIKDIASQPARVKCNDRGGSGW
jgi:hypothetical protein